MPGIVKEAPAIHHDIYTLRWRHNECDSISNHQPHNCLLNRLFRCRWKKTSKLRVTGLYAGNSPVPGESPAQMASNVEIVSIWWRHHACEWDNVQGFVHRFPLKQFQQYESCCYIPQIRTQTITNWWVSARKTKLQCVSNGVTSFLH